MIRNIFITVNILTIFILSSCVANNYNQSYGIAGMNYKYPYYSCNKDMYIDRNFNQVAENVSGGSDFNNFGFENYPLSNFPDNPYFNETRYDTRPVY